MMGLQAPTFRMIAAAYACAAFMALATWTVLHFPVMGARFVATPGNKAVRVVMAGRRPVFLAPESTVSFLGPTTRVVARAGDLPVTNVPDPAGPAAQKRYEMLGRLHALALAGPVRLVLPADGAGMPLQAKKPGLFDLGPDYWLLVSTGCASFLLGAWIVVLRPRDWGARMLALSGLGMMGAALGSAVYVTRELAAPGLVMQAMIWLNVAGTQLCGGALIALFFCYPRALVRPRQLLWIVPPVAGLAVLSLAGILTIFHVYVTMLLEFFVLLMLLGMQWSASRRDPLARAALTWMGLSTLFGTSAYVLMALAPLLLLRHSFVSQGSAFLLLFTIYAGIAAGVGRYKLFDLDRWAYRLLLGVSAAFGLLLIDGALIGGLRLQAADAFGISALLIGIVYLPVRTLLWRRILGQDRMQDGALFEAIETVRFAPDEAARRTRWQALLVQLFDPLEVRDAQYAVERPVIQQDGLEMVLPAVAGGNPLVLRFAGKGRKLFSPRQAALASQLLALMKSADGIRDSYAKGVIEERSRIARDLHDDVSGRLLTSLDRPSRSLLREDVRTAIADIRTILRGLTGERLAASQVIANLRHETFTRLDDANIALEWPIDLARTADPVLDYARYRSISSAHREIVTNILRHAQASIVTVRHTVSDTVFSLMVEDNGIGCDAAVETGGRGLANIERRLREIGGSAILVNGAQGFRVELSAPLTDAPSGLDAVSS